MVRILSLSNVLELKDSQGLVCYLSIPFRVDQTLTRNGFSSNLQPSFRQSRLRASKAIPMKFPKPLEHFCCGVSYEAKSCKNWGIRSPGILSNSVTASISCITDSLLKVARIGAFSLGLPINRYDTIVRVAEIHFESGPQIALKRVSQVAKKVELKC